MTAASYLDTAALAPGYYHAGAVYHLVTSARGHLTVYRGRRAVAVVTGTGLEWRTSSPQVRGQVLAVAADPEAARLSYAHTTGRCWRCGRQLTHPVSVTAGLGPECAAAVAPPPQGSLL